MSEIEVMIPNREDILNKTVRQPITGIATVTATPSELFAGVARLENRRYMAIKNEHPSIRCRIGGDNVSQQNGFPIEPGTTIEIEFDTMEEVLIYAVSEGDQMEVTVIEY